MKRLKILSTVKKFLFYFLCVVWAFFALFFGAFIIERKVFYPLSDYKNEIISAAREYEIDAALLFAVIRTESAFDKNAVSDKGAAGLMQITEKTAAYVASLRGIEEYDLFDAATNIDFGCYYFKYLENRFSDKNTCLAAYNAGEGKVFSWLKDERYSKDGKTLFLIPFKETDEYVKKVNKSLGKYQNLYFNILDKR